MPTGYTCIIEERDDVTFAEFALRCARAFGVCIHQREESVDAPPRPPEVSTYHADRLRTATAKLAAVRAMPPEQCDALARETHGRRLREHRDLVQSYASKLARYDAMLAAIDAWTPPTTAHENLRAFMRDQIAISTRHMRDLPAAPKSLTGAEWRAKEIENLEWDVDYHTKHDAQERASAAEAKAWLDALTKSLGVTP